jgi:hypothetical protein
VSFSQLVKHLEHIGLESFTVVVVVVVVVVV